MHLTIGPTVDQLSSNHFTRTLMSRFSARLTGLMRQPEYKYAISAILCSSLCVTPELNCVCKVIHTSLRSGQKSWSFLWIFSASLPCPLAILFIWSRLHLKVDRASKGLHPFAINQVTSRMARRTFSSASPTFVSKIFIHSEETLPIVSLEHLTSAVKKRTEFNI